MSGTEFLYNNGFEFLYSGIKSNDIAAEICKMNPDVTFVVSNGLYTRALRALRWEAVGSSPAEKLQEQIKEKML